MQRGKECAVAGLLTEPLSADLAGSGDPPQRPSSFEAAATNPCVVAGLPSEPLPAALARSGDRPQPASSFEAASTRRARLKVSTSAARKVVRSADGQWL